MSESAAAMLTKPAFRKIDWQKRQVARALSMAESPIDSHELSDKNCIDYSLTTFFRDGPKRQAPNPYSLWS